MTIPQKRLARGGPIRSVNVERHEKNWSRAYHSLERVVFVKQLPCIVCGVRRCHNSHTQSGGASRKADYTMIVPACTEHHHELDSTDGRAAFEAKYSVDLAQCAATTEALWQAHAAREGFTV